MLPMATTLCPNPTPATIHGEPEDGVASTLIAYLGSAMIATGQPVNEIEEELVEVGVRLGFRGIQVGAAPTESDLPCSPARASTGLPTLVL